MGDGGTGCICAKEHATSSTWSGQTGRSATCWTQALSSADCAQESQTETNKQTIMAFASA